MVPALVTFLWLCFAHCIADYALQSNFIATAKNRHTDLGKLSWKTVLSAHSVIHGGSAALVLHFLCGLPWSVVTVFGIAEFATHFAIDFGKCENWFNFHVDQALHIVCKALWVVIAFTMLSPVVAG